MASAGTAVFTAVANFASVIQQGNLAKAALIGLTLPITAIGIASVASFASFETAITAAGLKANATTAEMEAMKAVAIEMGATTAFSSLEAAQALDGLAASGLTAEESMAALPGVMNAAQASGSDLALTSKTVAGALNAFALEASDATHIADVFAQAANTSAIDMQGLGDALAYAGVLGASANQSLEDVVASISNLANQGVPAASAGTAIAQMMQSLQSPTRRGAKAIEELNIELRDTTGEMLPLPTIMKNFELALSDTNPELLASADAAGKSAKEYGDFALRAIFGVEGMKAMNLSIADGKPLMLSLTEDLAQVNMLTEGLARVMGVDAALAFVEAHTQGDKFVATGADAVQAMSAMNLASDGLSESMGRVIAETTTARLENMVGAFQALAIEIGGRLKPALDSVVGVLTDVAGGMADVVASDWGPMIVGAGAFLALLSPMLYLSGAVRTAIAGVAAQMVLLRAVALTAGLTGFFGPLIIGAQAAAAAIKGVMISLAPLLAVGVALAIVYQLATATTAAEDAEKAIQETWDVIDQAPTTSGKLEALNAALLEMTSKHAEAQEQLAADVGFSWSSLGQRMANPFTDPFQDQRDSVDLYGQAIEDLGGKLDIAETNIDALSRRYGMSREAVIALASAHGIDLSEGLGKGSVAFDAVVRSAKAAAAEEDAAYVSTMALAGGFLDAEAAADAFRTALDEMTGDFKNSFDAQVDYHEGLLATTQLIADQQAALEGLTEAERAQNNAIDEATGKIDLLTDAGIALAQDRSQAADDVNAYIEALIREGDTEGALAATVAMRDKFVADSIAAGMSKDAAIALADGLLGIPSEVLTTILLTGGPELQAEVNRISGELDGVTATERVAEIRADADLNAAVLALSEITDIPYETLLLVIANVVPAQELLDGLTEPDEKTIVGAAEVAAAEEEFLGLAVGSIKVVTADADTVAAEEEFGGLVNPTDKEIEAIAEVQAAEDAFLRVQRGTSKVISVIAKTDEAEGKFGFTSRPREQNSTSIAHVGAAESAFGATARARIQNSTTQPHTGAAEAAFGAGGVARARKQLSTTIALTGGAEAAFGAGGVARARTQLTTAIAETGAASAEIAALTVPRTTTVTVRTIQAIAGGGLLTPGGVLTGFAGGGLVRGPGTDTSDSVFARMDDGGGVRLSNYEFVVQAKQVRKVGPSWMAAFNAGMLNDQLPTFAEGGGLRDRFRANRGRVLGRARRALIAQGASREFVENAAERIADQRVQIRELVINNPRPEPARESLARAIRKATYLRDRI